MHYCKSLIRQAYLQLGEFSNFNFLRVIPVGERDFFRGNDRLENETSVGPDVMSKIGYLYSDAFEAGEVKGFLAGIYFALKLSEEYKEDLEKVKEFINSFED